MCKPKDTTHKENKYYCLVKSYKLELLGEFVIQKHACMHIELSELSFLSCFVAVATARDEFPPLESGMNY